MKTAHSSDNNPHIKSYFDSLVKLGELKGLDYNIGEKLPSICEQVGFNKIEHYITQNKLNVEKLRLHCFYA